MDFSSPPPTSIPWWCRALSPKCARLSLDPASTGCRATSSVVTVITACGPASTSCRRTSFQNWRAQRGRVVQNSSRLSLSHYWVAFAVFLPAVFLGAWQMLMRSPLPAPLDDPDAYYASVTLHGTAMAYVVTTFFTMGFGYAVAATSLGRPVRGVLAAWIGFVICLIGTVMATVIVLAGRATVLYTFYPPLLGSAWYYVGVL